MSRSLILSLAFALLLLSGPAQAQDSSGDEKCTGPIYTTKEVSRRVKILSYPQPEMPNHRRANEVNGTVILKVVACGNGKITDIEVVNKQPYGLTEEAVKAARKVRFRPAEKDGQLVSQWVRFEYNFRTY